MVKRIFLVLMVGLFLASASIAYADLIYEPQNDFCREHLSDLVALNRNFTANGNNGSVAVKDKPEAKKDITSIKNGTGIFIQYSCLYGGEYWGYSESIMDDSRRYSGWVKLDQMLVHYDHVAFAEQHQGELYAYKGVFLEITDSWSFVPWDWPGAGTHFSEITVYPERINILHAYRDKDGREWGFVTDNKGINCWACLSDPLNQDIPAFNPAPEPYLWVSRAPHVDILEQEKGNDPPIVAISAMVVLVVAGTAALIRVYWKRKPNVKNS